MSLASFRRYARRRPGSPFLRALIVVGLGVVLVGCAGPKPETKTVGVVATGDPGVTLRVISNPGRRSEQGVLVPSTVLFEGNDQDIQIVHGAERGRVHLRVVRGGSQVGAPTLTKAGQTAWIEVRGDEVKLRVEPDGR